MGGNRRVLGGDLENPEVAGENPLFPKFQSRLLQQNPVRYENLMNRLEPFQQRQEASQQRLDQRLDPFRQRQELQRQKIKGLLGGIDPNTYRLPLGFAGLGGY